MKRFEELYSELDATTKTIEKVEALKRYFSEAPPEDAAWALFFISGEKIPRAAPTSLLRDWVAEEAGLPLWLVEESYHTVGDLAEALALLLPDSPESTSLSLHEIVEGRLLQLKTSSVEEKRRILVESWRELSGDERYLFNKLITGNFRVGVSKTLLVRALSSIAGVETSIMSHRLMGKWSPTAESYLRLLDKTSTEVDITKPYPFYLAHPLEPPVQELGDHGEWQAEWKWDGIRAQLIKRSKQVFVWSRGEDLATDRFPEIAQMGMMLPDGTVLDGEILGWKNDQPLPFADLQTRIGRKKLDKKVLDKVPVIFMAYDLLESKGQDLRETPMQERRSLLEALVTQLNHPILKLSSLVESSEWGELATLRESSRERNVEGFMLKRKTSAYKVGRVKGDWWKWKIDPYHIDAVLIYAQPGHGRRANLYTDYTFGLWHEGTLVPVAKAYSGLTDEEIKLVDQFVRKNTLERFGPVRHVKPELVFELAFEGIQLSPRHKSGVAVRFPRMARWRQDKKAEEADSLETLKGLIHPPKS